MQLSTIQPTFFYKNPATTKIYTLSLHDALPICNVFVELRGLIHKAGEFRAARYKRRARPADSGESQRSEEHTSELQSRQYLVCRLLLEKKNIMIDYFNEAISKDPNYALAYVARH